MARDTTGGPLGFLTYFLRSGFLIAPILGAIYGFMRMQSWTAAFIAAGVFTAVMLIPAIAGYRRKLRAESGRAPAWMTKGQSSDPASSDRGEKSDDDGTGHSDPR